MHVVVAVVVVVVVVVVDPYETSTFVRSLEALEGPLAVDPTNPVPAQPWVSCYCCLLRCCCFDLPPDGDQSTA